MLSNPGKPRNETIDVVRLVAAIAIVYVHAVRSPALDASRNLLRFAVPFYLFASFYFQSLSLRTKTDCTLGQYILRRIKRLYLPFLAWSFIYLIARDVRRVELLHLGLVRLEPSLLWTGIEYQLWFLPYLLAASTLLAIIHWTTLKRDRRWRWPLIAAAIAAGFVVAGIHLPANWDQLHDNTYVQNWRALPAVCWGLAFAWFMTMGPRVYRVPFGVGIGGILLTIVCSVQQALHGIQLIPRALTGFGAMLAALAPWHGRLVPVLARLGRCSFGIYLCHVLVAEVVRDFVAHFHVSDSPARDMLIFFPTLIGSAALVMLFGRSPRLAWLNG